MSATHLAVISECLLVLAFSSSEQVAELAESMDLTEPLASMDLLELISTRSQRSYVALPRMLINYEGNTVTEASTQEACAGACDQESTCTGYSWSMVHKKCVWTPRKMDFDFSWRSWIKGSDGWYSTDGLILESVYKEYQTEKTENFCEVACNHDKEECQGFSYNKRLQRCRLSKENYDAYSNPAYTFYEKRGMRHNPAPAPQETQRMDNPIAAKAKQEENANQKAFVTSVAELNASRAALAQAQLEVQTASIAAANVTEQTKMKIGHLKAAAEKYTEQLAEEINRKTAENILQKEKLLNAQYETAKRSDDLALVRDIMTRENTVQRKEKEDAYQAETLRAEDARAQVSHMRNLGERKLQLSTLRDKMHKLKTDLQKAQKDLELTQEDLAARIAAREKRDQVQMTAWKASFEGLRHASQETIQQAIESGKADITAMMARSRKTASESEMALLEATRNAEQTEKKMEGLEASQLKAAEAAAQKALEAREKRLIEVRDKLEQDKVELLAKINGAESKYESLREVHAVRLGAIREELETKKEQIKADTQKMLDEAKVQSAKEIEDSEDNFDVMKAKHEAILAKWKIVSDNTSQMAIQREHAELISQAAGWTLKAEELQASLGSKITHLENVTAEITARSNAAHDAYTNKTTQIQNEMDDRMAELQERSNAETDRVAYTQKVKYAVAEARSTLERAKAKTIWQINYMKNMVKTRIRDVKGITKQILASIATYTIEGESGKEEDGWNYLTLEVSKKKLELKNHNTTIFKLLSTKQTLEGTQKALKLGLDILEKKWVQQTGNLAAQDKSLKQEEIEHEAVIQKENEKLLKVAPIAWLNPATAFEGLYFTMELYDNDKPSSQPRKLCKGAQSFWFEMPDGQFSDSSLTQVPSKSSQFNCTIGGVLTKVGSPSKTQRQGKRYCDNDDRCTGVLYWYKYSLTSALLCYGNEDSAPTTESAIQYYKQPEAKRVGKGAAVSCNKVPMTHRGFEESESFFFLEKGKLHAANSLWSFPCCSVANHATCEVSKCLSDEPASYLQMNPTETKDMYRSVRFANANGAPNPDGAGHLFLQGNATFKISVIGSKQFPPGIGPLAPNGFGPAGFAAGGGNFELKQLDQRQIQDEYNMEKRISNKYKNLTDRVMDELNNVNDHAVPEMDKCALWSCKNPGNCALEKCEGCPGWDNRPCQCQGEFCKIGHHGVLDRIECEAFHCRKPGNCALDQCPGCKSINGDLLCPSKAPTKSPTQGPTSPSPTSPNPLEPELGSSSIDDRRRRAPTKKPTPAPTQVATIPELDVAKEMKSKSALYAQVGQQVKKHTEMTTSQSHVLLHKQKAFELDYKSQHRAIAARAKVRDVELQHKRALYKETETEEVAVKTAERTSEASSKSETAEKLAKVSAQIEMKRQDTRVARALAQAQDALSKAAQMPSNSAPGSVAKQTSELQVSDIPGKKARAYLMFDTSDIVQAADIILATHLRVYKVSGDESQFVVLTAPCSWDRTLTMTRARALIEGVRIAAGVFPARDGIWIDLPLDVAVLRKTRSEGKFMCFELKGGPANKAPVVVGSEMSKEQPVLTMVYSKGLARASKPQVFKKSQVAKQIEERAAKAQKRITLEQDELLKEEIRLGFVEPEHRAEKLALAVKLAMSEWRQGISPEKLDQFSPEEKIRREFTKLTPITIELASRQSAETISKQVLTELDGKYTALGNKMVLDLFKVVMDKKVREGMKPRVKKLLDAQVLARNKKIAGSLETRLKKESQKLTALNGSRDDELREVIHAAQKIEMEDTYETIKYDEKLRKLREETRFEVCNEIYADVVKNVSAIATKKLNALIMREYDAIARARITEVAYKNHKEIFANLVSLLSKDELAKWIANHESGNYLMGKSCMLPYCSKTDKEPVKLAMPKKLKLTVSYVIPYCRTRAPSFSPTTAPTTPTTAPTTA